MIIVELFNCCVGFFYARRENAWRGTVGAVVKVRNGRVPWRSDKPICQKAYACWMRCFEKSLKGRKFFGNFWDSFSRNCKKFLIKTIYKNLFFWFSIDLWFEEIPSRIKIQTSNYPILTMHNHVFFILLLYRIFVFNQSIFYLLFYPFLQFSISRIGFFFIFAALISLNLTTEKYIKVTGFSNENILQKMPSLYPTTPNESTC